MPKEIRPCAFSSRAVPRSGLSCNLLSPTRATPSRAVHGEGALLCCSSLGTGAGPPRPWREAAAPRMFPMAPHAMMLKAGPAWAPLTLSWLPSNVPAKAGSCPLQAGPSVPCQRVLLLHPSRQGSRSPWWQLWSWFCLCPWLFYSDLNSPPQMLLPPLPQSLSFRGYRKDFFF